MRKSREAWTLAQELNHELRILRTGGKLDGECDAVRTFLIDNEIAALNREVGTLKQAAGIPHLQLVK